jgi:hypothetical protein
MEEEEIFKFEKIQGQIEGFYKEIGILSRKSPNDAVNKFKLKFINQLLTEANILLSGDYKPLEGFDIFDEEDLPSNSDVTMIFEQYLNCLEKLRADNIQKESIYWYWLVEGELSEHRTTIPTKLKDKK